MVDGAWTTAGYIQGFSKHTQHIAQYYSNILGNSKNSMAKTKFNWWQLRQQVKERLDTSKLQPGLSLHQIYKDQIEGRKMYSHIFVTIHHLVLNSHLTAVWFTKISTVKHTFSSKLAKLQHMGKSCKTRVGEIQ